MSTTKADPVLSEVPDSEAGEERAKADARRRSRRGFLAAGVSLAAASLAAPRPARAQQGTQDRTRKTIKDLIGRLPQPDRDPFGRITISSKGWDSALVKLVRRITNGVTPSELALARKLGFYGYLNYHLDYAKIDDSAATNYITQNFPYALMDASQLYPLDQGQVKLQFVNATLYRAAFSKRQLYERMAELWTDHFTVSYNDVQYMKVVDDRDVARKHALGMFPDMVRASAHSPAMLEYLDNTRNRGNNPNQNYARELMELHTLGVDGGYTQDDVAELSRCFTGWTIAPRGVGFNFDPTGHDFRAKTVLGHNIAAQSNSAGALGKSDGDYMIDVLVKHPSTAVFIAKKMLKWMLRYDPSQAQIDAVAAAYTKTNGDIKAMLRAVLTPNNLLATPAKYRRPFGFVVASLRATSPNLLRISGVTNRLTVVGQYPYDWPTPDGYPDTSEYWAGGVLQRWNFASYLTTNTTDAVVDMAPYLAAPTPNSVVDLIGSNLFGGEMPEALRAQLLSYLQAGTVNATRVRETLALAMSSSTFQWI